MAGRLVWWRLRWLATAKSAAGLAVRAVRIGPMLGRGGARAAEEPRRERISRRRRAREATSGWSGGDVRVRRGERETSGGCVRRVRHEDDVRVRVGVGWEKVPKRLSQRVFYILVPKRPSYLVQ